MGKLLKFVSSLMLLTAMGILLSLFNKAEIRSSPLDHTITVVVDGQGVAGLRVNGNIVGTQQASCDAAGELYAEPNAGNVFVEWTSDDGISIINPTSATEAWFRMIDSDVTVTAHFRSTSSAPSDPHSDPPSDPPSDPKEDSMEYFFENVANQVDDMLKSLNNAGNNPEVLKSLKEKGITIEAGTWESFDKETSAKIDQLLRMGVPVTINYIHKNEQKTQKKTLPIPGNFQYSLADLCDENNGFIGFENILYTVVNKKKLEKQETTHNELH